MGFYADITKNYGPEVTRAMKEWSNINVKIASFRNRIVFLKKCKQFSIFPKHIINSFKSLDYCTVGCNNHFVREAHRISYNFKLRILRWELNNSHSHLADLVGRRRQLVTYIKVSIPSGMFNNFNNNQIKRYTQRFLAIKRANKIKLWQLKFNSNDNSGQSINNKQSQTKINCNGRSMQNSKNKQSQAHTHSHNINNQHTLNIQSHKTNKNNSNLLVAHQHYDNIAELSDQTSEPHQGIEHNTEFFKNLTNLQIPSNVIDVLAKGPKFSLPIDSSNLPLHRLLADYEDILNVIPNEERDNIRSTLAFHTSKFLATSKRGKNTQDQRDTNNFLKQNRDVVVTISDKSNVTVCMYKHDYHSKIIELLNDASTYKKLTSDPTYSYERKTLKFIKDLKDKYFINETTYKTLCKRNSATPRIYGIPKIHKEGVPLRPIISNIDGHTKHLAKFLADILKLAFHDYNEFRVKDSFSFAERMKDMMIPEDYSLVSFDVVSLFTNIPLNFIITIIEENWFLIDPHTKIPKKEFINLLNWVFSSVYFKYCDDFYLQIHGTPMGSSLSPIVADVVMNTVLKNIRDQVPYVFGFMYQYVDDLACALPTVEIENTLNLFNNICDKLAFTYEVEQNGTLPFLDTVMVRSGNLVKLRWYRKPSNSNRLLNFNSNCPTKYKTNLVLAMKNRISKISHRDFLNQDLKILYDILIKNSFPVHFTKRLLFSTANTKKVIPSVTHDITATLEPVELPTYRSLIYVPGLTDRVKKLFTKYNMNIAFTSAVPSSRFFTKLKCPLPVEQHNNIVYAVQCLDCHQYYIGQSSQRWRERKTQHKSDARLHPHKCALAGHIKQSKHTINFEHPVFLFQQTNYNKRIALEALAIAKVHNNLNAKEQSSNFSNIYNNIIQHYKLPIP